MGATYTEAQKKATKKYQSTLSNISIRIKKEEYERIKKGVEKTGASLREFVIEAINEKLEREKPD